MTEPNTIKASDLVKQIQVTEAAIGLWNYCEKTFGKRWNCPEFHELGDKLRNLGLAEVTIDAD